MGIWTIAELGIGVVSACLPTMRPLFSECLTGVRRHPSAVESEPPMAETRGDFDPELGVGLRLQQSPSNPAHSDTFAHLGVLGGLQHEAVDFALEDRSSEKEQHT